MAIITITTDFGSGSPYIAEMKGAILSIAPQVTIVDITHAVAPQEILSAALVLRQVTPAFPEGTTHVAVVDPGVGTNRSILLVHARGQYFIAPDNGLLSLVMDDDSQVREADQAEFWRAPVSSTFHGRDIMAPIAAHLANGVSPSQLGSAFAKAPVRLAIPEAKTDGNLVRGEVIYIDSFGNLITNLSSALVEEASARSRIEFQGRSVDLVQTYAAGKRGQIIALTGSSGWLEIAISGGNARDTLAAQTGEAVLVRRE